MREIDWKVRMSAHHMDHSSAISAVLFAFRKSLSLNVEEMTTASDLAPVEIMDLDMRHPYDSMLHIRCIARGTDNVGTLCMRPAQSAPISVYSRLAEGTQFTNAFDAPLEHVERNRILSCNRVKVAIPQCDRAPVLSKLTHWMRGMKATFRRSLPF